MGPPALLFIVIWRRTDLSLPELVNQPPFSTEIDISRKRAI
jgi:hypothetical protein